MFLNINRVIVASSTVSFLSKNAYISSSFYIKSVGRYVKMCITSFFNNMKYFSCPKFCLKVVLQLSILSECVASCESHSFM